MGSFNVPRIRCVLLCLTGLALQFLLFRNAHFPVNDFTGFWIGGKLLGTPYLYDVGANLALQQSMTGHMVDGLIFIRPPFFAAGMKLLMIMPYESAILLWRIMLGASFAGFVALFPLAPRWYAALAICWSPLVAKEIAIKNDVPLILLLLTTAIVAWRGKHLLTAGVLLGLCLGKFHFLTLLPLLLFRRENRRVLAGFVSVAVALLCINFLVQPEWIRLYWAGLNMPQKNMNWTPDLMPNFYAAFFRTGHPAAGVALGAIVTGTAVWVICRRHTFEVALPFCILGGILVSPHTTFLDGVLALPALLATAHSYANLRLPAAALLSPIVTAMYIVGPGGIGPALFAGGCLAIMVVVARTHGATVTTASGT